jgi:hypothetical protein
MILFTAAVQPQETNYELKNNTVDMLEQMEKLKVQTSRQRQDIQV